MAGDKNSSYSIENKAQVFFEYQVRAHDPLTKLDKTSNTVITYPKFIDIDLIETVEQEVLVCGSLCYKIEIANRGNVTLFNACLASIMPKEVCLSTECITINGVEKSDLDPSMGFNIGVIEPGAHMMITFCVCVLEAPPDYRIYNQVQLNYDYRIDQQDMAQTATLFSNRVETKVNEVGCTVIKKVSRQYVNRYDYLAYEVLIQNTGNVVLKDVCFKDPLDPVLVLLPQTVYINKRCYEGDEPDKGIKIGDIKAHACYRVTFCVQVMDFPSSMCIASASEVSFCYQLLEKTTVIKETKYSNQTVSYLFKETENLTKPISKKCTTKQAIGFSANEHLQVIQEVDCKYATLNDVIGYTIKILNGSPVKIDQVRFRDVMPIETVLVQDSVSIDGEVKKGYDPYESFALEGIVPGQIVEISFKSKVKTVPPFAVIDNRAVVTGAYKNTQTQEMVYKEVQSNKVSIQINYGELSIVQSVDKSDAGIQEIITYTFELTNKGNIAIEQVVLMDTLQQDVLFRKGSVSIDGRPTTYSPKRGIPLGILSSMQRVEVKFQVKVAEYPRMGLVINSAIGQFQYKVDPGGRSSIQTVTSNNVCTFLIVPWLNAQQIVDQRYHMLLDKVNYRVKLINEGNIAFQKMFFQNQLTQEMSFIEDSVTINELPQKTLDPVVGFYLPTIEVGDVITVEFGVQIRSVAARGYELTHATTLTGHYMIQSGSGCYDFTEKTNFVITEVRAADVKIDQYVNLQYAQVGDYLTYTFLITHIGNVGIKSLRFFDKLDPVMTFRAKSVVINGIAYPGLDPTAGFGLGRLMGNQQIKIQFDVKVKMLPYYKDIVNKGIAQFCYQMQPSALSVYKTQVSNSVMTSITLGDLCMTQSCDKALAAVGEVITYTTQITNIGNVRATRICFKALLREDVVLTSDGVDPIKGMMLDDLEIGCTTSVTFQVLVTMKPFENKVIGQSAIQFAYEPYPGQSEVYKTVYSNKSVTQVIVGDLDVIKQVDREIAIVGEKLTYTISLINTGNTNAQNVYFVDVLPAQTLFIRDSVCVNGVHCKGYHPQVGFKIGTITPGQIVKITYQVCIER